MTRVKASNSLKKMSVLYVEDEDFIRESFSNILSRSIKQFRVACNGKEGLEIYKKHNIDIVISDINMPQMDGLDMAKKIKEIEPESIVVFTTAFGDSANLQKSIDIGVDGYLIKPIDINKVFIKLNSLAKIIDNKNISQRHSALLRVILDEQKEAIVLLDENLDIKISNNSFNFIFNKLTGKKLSTIDDICNLFEYFDDTMQIDKEWFKNIDTNKELTLKYLSDKNNIKYFQSVTKRVEEYIIFSLTDITELKQESKKLQEEILKDKLTGIYNRKVIDAIFDKLRNKNLYMLLLDIDNFKIINDTYGHATGDEVLKSLAKLLKSSLRDNDTVIRWGGEEFVVLLNTVKSLETASLIAESLREKINYLQVEDIKNISCSFGVSSLHVENPCDINTLFNQADKLLYKAKKEGKNRVKY